MEGLDIKSIQSFYDNIQLPIPTDKDVEGVKDDLSSRIIPPGAKKRLEKKIYKEEDYPVWDKLGYGDLFRWRLGKDQKDWKILGRLLNHPLMRTSLDVCIIINMDIEKVTLVLPQVYTLELNEKVVQLYKTYFAAFETYQKTDWNGYLERLRDDQYVYTRIFAALTRPREEVLHLCGLPAEKQFADFLKNLLATANYKFNYYSRQGTPEGDASAVNWAKIGVVAGEKFEKYGAGDVSDFSRLVQTEFTYVEPSIDTISPELAIAMRPRTDIPDDPNNQQ